MMRRLGRPGALTATLIALVWAGSSPAGASTLEGTAAYRERIALPPDAVFEAELQDVSRADAPATALGRAVIDPAGPPPFRFQIAYDDAAIQPGRRYVVRAAVRHQGRLLLTTDQAYPVLTGGAAAPLRLLLVSAAARPRPSSRTAPEDGPLDLPASYEGELRSGAGAAVLWHLDLLPLGRYQLRTTHKDSPEPNRFDDIGRWRRDPDSGRLLLRGGREASIAFMPSDGGRALRKADAAGELQRLPQPALIEPRLTLTGMFAYMADAATIVLCADGARLPVAMEGDYKALEAAYLKERHQPGEALLASLDGLIARRRVWWWSGSSGCGAAKPAAIGWPTARCATPTGSWCA